MSEMSNLDRMKDRPSMKEAISEFLGKAVDGDTTFTEEEDIQNFKKLLRDHYEQTIDVVFDVAQSEIEKIFLNSLVMGFAIHDPLGLVIQGPRKDAPSWASNLQEAFAVVRQMRKEGKDLKGYCDWLEQNGDLDKEEIDRWRSLVIVEPFWGDAFHVIPQAGFPELKVGKRGIRTDMMIFAPMHPDVRIIVECDGYEWHSNKETFSSDRQRDRLLASKGYEVMRYSGSEICGNPVICAGELFGRLEERRAEWLK